MPDFFRNARNIQIIDSQFNVAHNEGLTGLQILFQNIIHGATHDAAERYPPPKCHPNTRKAIVNNIIEWTHRSLEINESQMFWLNGPAGVGKTAIAQTVCERLQESHRPSGSFFFSRTVAMRSDPKSLFSTIAYQLAIAMPATFGKAIEEKIKGDPSILKKNMTLQLEKLIIEPIQLLDFATSPPVIVIDGLDECQGETTQGEIVRLLGSLSQHGDLPIKVILTSRPEPWICHEFDAGLFLPHTRRLFLEQTSETDEDIRTFLRSGFSDVCSSPDHRSAMEDISKPWPADSVVDELVDKASGQFIYASTLLKFVGDPFKCPPDQLDLVLAAASTSKNNSTNPFADLDRLYIEILSTSPDKQQTLDVLGAVLALMDVKFEWWQLFVGYMKQLLDLQPEKALRSIRSLTDISEDGRVKFFHKSFPDFLLDASRSDSYFIDINVMHSRMAVACLKSIRLRYTTETDIFSSPDEISRTQVQCAVRFWDAHWMLSAATHQSQLCDEIKSIDASLFYYHVTQGWVRERASTVQHRQNRHGCSYIGVAYPVEKTLA
ncbi:hypothetical protein BDZ97DRAFT_1914481 [Flammula alnicola]|nr:hypothetical protein BDZ97DRAFT_1914481 [Flammula alnicola]